MLAHQGHTCTAHTHTHTFTRHTHACATHTHAPHACATHTHTHTWVNMEYWYFPLEHSSIRAASVPATLLQPTSLSCSTGQRSLLSTEYCHHDNGWYLSNTFLNNMVLLAIPYFSITENLFCSCMASCNDHYTYVIHLYSYYMSISILQCIYLDGGLSHDEQHN